MANPYLKNKASNKNRNRSLKAIRAGMDDMIALAEEIKKIRKELSLLPPFTMKRVDKRTALLFSGSGLFTNLEGIGLKPRHQEKYGEFYIFFEG